MLHVVSRHCWHEYRPTGAPQRQKYGVLGLRAWRHCLWGEHHDDRCLSLLFLFNKTLFILLEYYCTYWLCFTFAAVCGLRFFSCRIHCQLQSLRARLFAGACFEVVTGSKRKDTSRPLFRPFTEQATTLRSYTSGDLRLQRKTYRKQASIFSPNRRVREQSV